MAINANNPALLNLVNKSNLGLPEQLFVKQPKHAGHVGFVVRRKRPIELALRSTAAANLPARGAAARVSGTAFWSLRSRELGFQAEYRGSR